MDGSQDRDGTTGRSRLRWALVVAVVISLLGLAGPGSAATEWNPPPPVPDDNCGTKWDRIWIPVSDIAGYRIDGQWVLQGTWHSTNGAATVTVVATNSRDPEKSFTFTFGTEPDSTCVEAPNQVRIKIGKCLTSTTRAVTGYFTNPADTGWPLPYELGLSAEVDTPGRRLITIYAARWDPLPDGETAVLGRPEGLPSGGKGEFWFWLDGSQRSEQFGPTIFLKIPSCDGSNGDGPGGPGGKTQSRPKVTIGKLSCQRGAKVRLDTRKATSTVRFRGVIKPKRGKAVRINRAVKPGKRPLIRRPKVALPATVTVTYKLPGSKKVVVTKRLRRCG